MGIDEISTIIDGYYCLISTANHSGVVEAILQYSPFTGEKLSSAFLAELRFQISNSLSKRDKDNELLRQWNNHLSDYTPAFDVNLIPQRLKFLLSSRKWYDIRKYRDRAMHNGGNFCGEFAGCFIDTCYERPDDLPKLACVPIQYCPFCGVKLPPEFAQENWWEKEFKTFKWYKDHKMGEWADDYVDDCDWTEDDYPPIETK